MSAPREKKPPRQRPWRDNIEAVTMAIVMAVLLKYFIIEAYKIPTGSMQPTLMGLSYGEGNGIFDRILVDKLSYHYRDPERFEVVVFRYPLDRSKNFIKRVFGLPGEELSIRGGDIFVRGPGEDNARVARRSRPVQREMWKELDIEGEWRIDAASAGWELEERALTARDAGAMHFPRSTDSVRDHYKDGYPKAIADLLRRGYPGGSGENAVGDLRIEMRARAEASTREVRVELREGQRRYVARLPGPGAPEGAAPRLELEDRSGEVAPQEVAAERPWRLDEHRARRVALQNLDDLVELEVDGRVVAALEVPPATDQRSGITVATEGGGGRIEDLAVFRDIYYTTSRSARSRWSIPDDSYFMLGDNTQDSADSREWRLARRQIMNGDESGPVVRGNLRGSENPRVVTGGSQGTEIFFTDEFGERHHFLASRAQALEPVDTPFVPRGLITGRAVLVFWPMKPTLGVYRLKWIH